MLNTNNTGRKHRKQMKAAEIGTLETHIRKVCARIIDGTHATDRMAQKGVTAKEIVNALKYGEVIEIHNEANELRAVVRFAYGRPKVAVCVVVGMETGTVVTCWKNAGQDNHQTLNLYAYTWNVNACALFAPAQ